VQARGLNGALRVRCLQHAPHEGPGAVAAWGAARGHDLTATHAYRGEPLAALDDAELLVVLGGAYGVEDLPRLPWLRDEAAAIGRSIARDTPVLGICLGAQLVAHALGARVGRAAEREIGWLPVERAAPREAAPLLAGFPDRLDVFHWHGDEMEPPAGAVRAFRSAACACQAFTWGDRVAAVQFHPEMTAETAGALAVHDAADLVQAGTYVQTAEAMLADAARFERPWPALWATLDALADAAPRRPQRSEGPPP
jgi:GMP synthase-like glutamine amidotransferase